MAATYAEANDFSFHREQQEHQMKRSEVVFLREFRNMLQAGFRLIEHSAQGSSTTETLRLTTDGTALVWNGRSLPLVRVAAVSRADALLPKHCCAERCLALVTAAEVLVFETVDLETRDLIADGFDLLLAATRRARAGACAPSPPP